MAYDNPYEDGPEKPPEPSTQPEKEKMDEGEQTALLPKSFFDEGDLKVGYKCEVEITDIHDEQVSVRYLGSKEEETDKGPEDKPGEAEPASAGMGSSESDMYS